MIGYPLGPGGKGKLPRLTRRLLVMSFNHKMLVKPRALKIARLERRAIVRGDWHWGPFVANSDYLYQGIAQRRAGGLELCLYMGVAWKQLPHVTHSLNEY